MISHLLCHLLVLVLLSSRATTLGKPANSALECGEDKSCAILAQLMSTVSEMRNQLGRQATDLEELKTDLNKSLVSTASQLNDKIDKGLEELKTNLNKSLDSTAAISAQLGRHSTDLFSHDGHLKAHDVSQRSEYQLVQSIYGAELGPRDCNDIKERGYNASGVYRVYPGSDYKRIETDVYCDFQSLKQSWLVFQRRLDGSVNFERLWKDYAIGFGNLDGEFWLGNEKLSLLTMNRKYKLRIELEDFTGQKRWAEYSTFSVRPVTDNYRLAVGGYSGNAGDGMARHNGSWFSTKDVDNDSHPSSCAQMFRGSWWYQACQHSNLNGLYLGGSHTSWGDGIEWLPWHGEYYSLKATAMKIMAVY